VVVSFLPAAFLQGAPHSLGDEGITSWITAIGAPGAPTIQVRAAFHSSQLLRAQVGVAIHCCNALLLRHIPLCVCDTLCTFSVFHGIVPDIGRPARDWPGWS